METVHRSNWIRHIHAPLTWGCVIDHDKVHKFASDTIFYKHLETNHPAQLGELGPDEIPVFVKNSRIPTLRDAGTCPICNLNVAQLPPSREKDGTSTPDSVDVLNDESRMSRHIADHLMLLAMKSLIGIPLEPDQSEESGRASNGLGWENTSSHMDPETAKKIFNWVFDIPPDERDESIIPEDSEKKWYRERCLSLEPQHEHPEWGFISPWKDIQEDTDTNDPILTLFQSQQYPSSSISGKSPATDQDKLKYESRQVPINIGLTCVFPTPNTSSPATPESEPKVK